jgi:hypothetical protein
MLLLLDLFLTLVHIAIVLFNLFGWIPKTTRKAHFISILLTAVSWFLLGIWFGMGYCPFTDWQWRVKEQLGERNRHPTSLNILPRNLQAKISAHNWYLLLLLCVLL